MLLTEVEHRKKILFGGLKEGITNRTKKIEWQRTTDAVIKVSSVPRTIDEVKKKWYDLKLEAKKRISAFKQSAAATGSGSGLQAPSASDERIAGIIGEVVLSGILPEEEGDTDAGKCFCLVG